VNGPASHRRLRCRIVSRKCCAALWRASRKMRRDDAEPQRNFLLLHRRSDRGQQPRVQDLGRGGARGHEPILTFWGGPLPKNRSRDRDPFRRRPSARLSVCLHRPCFRQGIGAAIERASPLRPDRGPLAERRADRLTGPVMPLWRSTIGRGPPARLVEAALEVVVSEMAVSDRLSGRAVISALPILSTLIQRSLWL
jgi:hypothetical protein